MKLLLQNNIIHVDLPHRTHLKWSVWNDVIELGDGRAVLFNTFSRNAVLVNKEEIVEINKIPDFTLNELYKLNFIVDSSINEKEIWERSFCDGKEDLSYLDLTILLTQNCQMQCVYCFEGEKNKCTISDSALDSIMAFMESKKDVCKKLRVTWFGGEPLLAYNKLKELSLLLISFCKKQGIAYSADITTNGFALNRERCEELINDLLVKRYIITIDGPEPIHERRRPLQSGKSSFRRIWNNMEMLVDMGAQVTLRMTIDKDNASHIPALLDEISTGKMRGRIGLAFCRTIDYNYTSKEVSPSLYSTDEFEKIEWNLIQYAHSLGLWKYHFPHKAPSGGCLRKGDIVIGVNGEIYKCLDTVGNEKWVTGHIIKCAQGNTPEWYDCWNSWSPLKSENCKNCVLVPLCNGGCPHNALFSDKKHGKDSCCPDWKANYRKQIKSLVAEIYDSKTI